MRGFLRNILAVGLVVGLLASCSSPGTPYAYKDIKITTGPSATPAQPATTHPTTINFTIRNTWDKELVDVPWEIRLNTDVADPLSGAVVATGTVTIAAFSSAAQSFVLGTLAKGSYTYGINLDPANIIVEDNETNNNGQVTILVADQDISFGTPAPTITVDAGMGTPPTRPLTADFTILHTVNATAPTPADASISVDYTVTLNGATIISATTVVVNPAGPNPHPISIALPPTGSAGSFPYVIRLSTAVGDDNKNTNNTVTVVVTVPASG